MNQCTAAITDDANIRSAELTEHLRIAIEKKSWYVVDLIRLELSKIFLEKQKAKQL